MSALDKKLIKNMKGLKEQRKLTAIQKSEILDFFIKLTGEKIPLGCHEYFYSRTGIYAKEYIPKGFYTCELLPKANDMIMSKAYGDKNFCDIIFPKENMPRTFLKNINGYFYFDGEPVSRTEAVEKCADLGVVLIKPAMKSQGEGVNRITLRKGIVVETGKSVSELFDSYNSNYQIQECVIQHERMAALNPTSVNTMRIVTYRFDNEVVLVYSVVRIGRKGRFVDNQSAGGMSTVIDENGCLGKYAFAGYDEDDIEKADTGIVLEGYQLPSYDKVVAMVKRLHQYLPYFKIIGWDIAIGTDGEPILIEYNTRPGLSQSAFGPGFGKYTERIISELWPRRNSLYDKKR